MDLIGLVWLIPAVMFLAALINGLGVKKLGALAGFISVGAMGFTFLLSLLIFFNVRSVAHDHGHHGDDHGAHAEHAAHGHGGADMAWWEGLEAEAQAAYKHQMMFARAADPANPQPWETSVRDGWGGYVKLWDWFEIPNVLGTGKTLDIEMAFHVDQLTAIYLLFVSFVGTLVFMYATGYMREEHHGHVELDPGYARFFCYLALFAASMYTLVLGANMVVMFIGWEGVGLCSYLLIGYFFNKQFNEKLSCSDAGKKAFVVNRVGDFGLMLGMFLIFWGLGTVDFQGINHALLMGDVPADFLFGGATITAAALLLFLGATGKSAQIPLFIWLPDAMAGPTPVSALIHAATMVTAGIYMLARMNILFMNAPTALLVVAIVGALTAFVAAFAGLTQRGFKKILAYSTVSQLGYMFMACGVGAFAAGVFHVFTHAFFKACLFLCAGAVIHALHHEEDVFKMGGLRKKMPKTALAYLLATLAIAGVFGTAGFWSKDEILFLTYASGYFNGTFTLIWLVGVATVGMTAFYMGRSYFLVFEGKTRLETDTHGHHEPKGHEGHPEHDEGDHHAHHGVPYNAVTERAWSMTGVVLVLGVLSLLVGFLNVPKNVIPLGGANEVFHHFLEPVTDAGAMHIAADEFGQIKEGSAKLGPMVAGKITAGDMSKLPSDFAPGAWLLVILSQVVAFGGLGLAWLLYGVGDLEKGRKLAAKPGLAQLWAISWNAWKWDDLYDLLFIKGAGLVYQSVLWFDKTVIDGIVLGTGRVSRFIGNEFRRLQNGQVQVYGLVMFLGVCLFLLYFAIGLRSFIDRRPATETATPAGQVSAPPAGADEQAEVALAGHEE